MGASVPRANSGSLPLSTYEFHLATVSFKYASGTLWNSWPLRIFAANSSIVSALKKKPLVGEVNGGSMFHLSRSTAARSKIAQIGPEKKSGDFEPSFMARAACTLLGSL